MHELALAQSIADAGRKEMSDRKLRKVTAMHVSVGGLTHVVPDNLVFCFSAVVKDTALEGCRLVVTKTPIQAKCRRCRRTFEVSGGNFKCPDCGLADVELSGEQELTLNAIEAETDEED